MHGNGKHATIVKIHLAIIAHVIVAVAIVHMMGVGPKFRNLLPGLHPEATQP